MDRGGFVSLVVVAVLVGVAFFLLVSSPGGTAEPGDLTGTSCSNATVEYEIERGGEYDWTLVDLRDANGSALATVDVRIADTREKMYTGLSDTEALPDGEGMLFVHGEEGTYTYVMRRMDFPIDIVFVAENGTITTIHHAPIPEEIAGGNGEFPGTGKYVLEVPRGYTNQTGADVGDCVVIPASVD